MTSPTRNHGFTLLEVLIALAILAVASAGILSSLHQHIHLTSLADKHIARQVIAGNLMSEIRLMAHTLPNGRTTRHIDLADGMNWLAEIDIQPTDSPLLRRVEVTLNPAPTNGLPWYDAERPAALTGFIAPYQGKERGPR